MASKFVEHLKPVIFNRGSGEPRVPRASAKGSAAGQ